VEGAEKQKILDPTKLKVEASLSKQVGFVSLLELLVKQMGFVIEPYVNSLLAVLLSLIHHALALKYGEDAMESDDNEQSRISPNDKENFARVRRLGIRRLAQICDVFNGLDFSRFTPVILDIIAKEAKQIHQRVHDSNVGGIMQLCLVLSNQSKLAHLLGPSLGVLIDCLGLETLSGNVRSNLYTLLENILTLRYVLRPIIESTPILTLL